MLSKRIPACSRGGNGMLIGAMWKENPACDDDAEGGGGRGNVGMGTWAWVSGHGYVGMGT